MRQLPEQCESCKKQISTLEICALPAGTKKRGVEVTFRESGEENANLYVRGVNEGRRGEQADPSALI